MNAACAIAYSGGGHVEAGGDRRHGRAGDRDLGRVDILVNNAGIQHVAPVENFPAEQLGRDHRHQPLGRLPRHAAALPQMRERNWGRIINIASAHGLVAAARSRPMSPPSTASSA